MAAPTCTAIDANWSDWLVAHFVWPAVVQMGLAALLRWGLGPAYLAARRRQGRFRKIVDRYIGNVLDGNHQLARPGCIVALFILEAMSSVLSVIVWVQHTYWHSTRASSRALLVILAAVDTLNWLVMRLQERCSVRGVWQAGALIDVTTIVPAFRCGFFPRFCNAGQDWLSLHFLRAYSFLLCLKRIQATGIFSHVALRFQTLASVFFELVSMVVMMSGCMFTCELLGDPQFLIESCLENNISGESVTVMGMVYWTMVSITTVGFGDIAPRANLSRLLSIVFIVVGVSLIFRIQYRFTTIWNQNFEGAGNYSSGARAHIVLVLNVRGRPAQMSSMLSGFLREILHPGHLDGQDSWPDVVVFAPSLWEAGSKKDGVVGTTFDEFLRAQSLADGARGHVYYVIGKVTSERDLLRAGVGASKLTIIVGAMDSETPDEDDGQNIYAAMVIRSFFPQVRIRLMLLRPESKNLAVQSGIEATRCFSSRELKANILAQNVRCHGMIPSLIGMLQSVGLDELHRTHSIGSNWAASYREGLHRNVYGFMLSQDYDQKIFGQVATEIYKKTGAILIGVVDCGHLELCLQRPMARLRTGQVCFAIAAKESCLEPVTLCIGDEEADWRARLIELRERFSKRVRRDGVHVAAARIMRRNIRTELLELHEESEFYRAQSLCVRPSAGEIANDFTFGHFMSNLSLPSQGLENERGSARLIIRAMREAHLDLPDQLVLLVVCNGIVWQQVHTFCAALRADYQPVKKSVIVLAPTSPPAGIFDDFGENVQCMSGSFMSARTLVAAGLLEAHSVVVMSGEPPTEESLREPLFQDYQVVLCAQEVECWCGVTEDEVYAVYELQNSKSVRHMPPLFDKPIVSPNRLFYAQKGDDVDDELDIDDTISANFTANTPPTSSPRSKTTLSTKTTMYSKQNTSGFHFMTAGAEVEEDDAQNKEESISFHPRFAAGQLFTPELFGVMLGRMFYMPAVIELVEALLMPQYRGQRSYAWQIRVPLGYRNKQFAALFEDLATTGLKWDNIPEEDYATSENCSTDETATDAAVQQIPEGPSIPLAIYRPRMDLGPRLGVKDISPGTGAYHYNILAPDPSTRLHENDWILVLGSKQFGSKVNSMGLLRGSDPEKGSERTSRQYSHDRTSGHSMRTKTPDKSPTSSIDTQSFAKGRARLSDNRVSSHHSGVLSDGGRGGKISVKSASDSDGVHPVSREGSRAHVSFRNRIASQESLKSFEVGRATSPSLHSPPMVRESSKVTTGDSDGMNSNEFHPAVPMGAYG